MATLEMNLDQLNSDVQSMKSTITSKGVTVEDSTPLAHFPDKINEVYDKGSVDGVKAKNDEMWKKLLNNGKRRNYDYYFMGRAWNDDTFNPTCDIICDYDCMVSMFQYSRIQDLRGILNRNGVVLDVSAGGNMTNMFYGSSITHMPTLDLRMGKGVNLFSGLTSLETVEKLIVNESYGIGGNFFQNCTSLYEITFEGNINYNLNLQWCPLNTASIVNVVEHLWDGASGKTLTLNKTAVNNMTFPHTSAQSGITYNSWDNLESSKGNWTIALV